MANELGEGGGLAQQLVRHVQQVAELLVPGHQLAGAIEHRDALGHMVERHLQGPVGGGHLVASGFQTPEGVLPLVGQAVAFDQTLAEQRQRARHGGQLIMAGQRDLDIGAPARERRHGLRYAAERQQDRAQDQDRQRQREENGGDDDRPGDADRLGRPQLRRHAGPRRLIAQLGDHLRQLIVHGRDMHARLGHERVADHPPIVRVGIDRLEGARHQRVHLGTNGGDGGRVVRLQRRELAVEPTLGIPRLLLGEVEQADRQVREPVFQVAERLLGVARAPQGLDIAGLGDKRVGAILEFPVHIEVGGNEDDQKRCREQHQAGGDGEPGHAEIRVASYSGRRRHCGGLNSVMLMMPPRSPSLAPSFG